MTSRSPGSPKLSPRERDLLRHTDLMDMVRLAAQNGWWDDAERDLTHALDLWESCGYTRGVALAQINLGGVALATGKPHAAITLLKTAHDTLLRLPDHHEANRARAFLGRAHFVAGDREWGSHLLERTLRFFERTGAAHWRARTLELLGRCATERGRIEDARESYQQAAAMFQRTSPYDADRVQDLYAALPTQTAVR